MTADVNDLDQARRRLGRSSYDLWVRYVGLGGHDDAFGVRSYLSGGPAISDGEHDRLVLALDEGFVDAGNGRPLSFRPRLNPHRAPHPGYRRVERTPEGSSLRYEHGDSISMTATPRAARLARHNLRSRLELVACSDDATADATLVV